MRLVPHFTPSIVVLVPLDLAVQELIQRLGDALAAQPREFTDQAYGFGVVDTDDHRAAPHTSFTFRRDQLRKKRKSSTAFTFTGKSIA